MSEQEHSQKIAGYWMEKAEESLQSARLEYSQGHLDFCINRLYYAVFYAVSEVLASRRLKYGKHTAVRASLHRDFVKRGVISAKMGKLFDRLFYDRQEADYAVFVEFDKDVVADEIEEVEEFLIVFRRILEKRL
jgi:hypothetical protein